MWLLVVTCWATPLSVPRAHLAAHTRVLTPRTTYLSWRHANLRTLYKKASLRFATQNINFRSASLTAARLSWAKYHISFAAVAPDLSGILLRIAAEARKLSNLGAGAAASASLSAKTVAKPRWTTCRAGQPCRATSAGAVGRGACPDDALAASLSRVTPW